MNSRDVVKLQQGANAANQNMVSVSYCVIVVLSKNVVLYSGIAIRFTAETNIGVVNRRKNIGYKRRGNISHSTFLCCLSYSERTAFLLRHAR